MKNFFIGLLIGIVLCGVACFLIYPNIKQTAYDSGFDAGNKKGISTGTAAGITQGIAQLKAEQKQERDSLAMVEKNKEEQRLAAAHRIKRIPPPVQNWHVINGQIDEPVVDTSSKPAPKAHRKAH